MHLLTVFYSYVIIFMSNLIFTLMRNIFFLLAIVALVSLNSCKKAAEDLVGCSPLWALEVADEAMAASTAATAYSEDQSTENCLAYKEASQDYIDALEPLSDCSSLSGEERQTIQESIEETQADIDALTCE